VALPAARLVVEWVSAHPSALQERGFTARPQIWPGLARNVSCLPFPQIHLTRLSPVFSFSNYSSLFLFIPFSLSFLQIPPSTPLKPYDILGGK
jgi:hypothetical protein